MIAWHSFPSSWLRSQRHNSKSVPFTRKLSWNHPFPPLPLSLVRQKTTTHLNLSWPCVDLNQVFKHFVWFTVGQSPLKHLKQSLLCATWILKIHKGHPDIKLFLFFPGRKDKNCTTFRQWQLLTKKQKYLKGQFIVVCTRIWSLKEKYTLPLLSKELRELFFSNLVRVFKIFFISYYIKGSYLGILKRTTHCQAIFFLDNCSLDKCPLPKNSVLSWVDLSGVGFVWVGFVRGKVYEFKLLGRDGGGG